MESSLQRYAVRSSQFAQMPKNEFEHGEGLLHSEYGKDDEFLNVSQIVDKYIQLCNIKDDVLLRLYQLDAQYLTHFHDIAEREPALRGFYIELVHGWRNELLMTKTKTGKERDLQGAIGTRFVPASNAYGYGEQYANPNQNQDQNIFKRLFQRGQPPQQ